MHIRRALSTHRASRLNTCAPTNQRNFLEPVVPTWARLTCIHGPLISGQGLKVVDTLWACVILALSWSLHVDDFAQHMESTGHVVACW